MTGEDNVVKMDLKFIVTRAASESHQVTWICGCDLTTAIRVAEFVHFWTPCLDSGHSLSLGLSGSDVAPPCDQEFLALSRRSKNC